MANPLPPPRRVAVPVLVKDGKPCSAGYGKGFDAHPMVGMQSGNLGSLAVNATTGHHHGFGQHSFAPHHHHHQSNPMGLAPVSSVITQSPYYMQNTWW